MDMSKLSPAPWLADCRPAIPGGPVEDGYGVLRGVCRTHGSVEFKAVDVAFVALARNAFDVMMRRGWWVVPCTKGVKWFVRSEEAFDLPLAFYDELHQGNFDDPFTALVEADRWYAANVEAVTPPATDTPNPP